MPDTKLFDTTAFPLITILNGNENLAAEQNNQNKVLNVDLLKDFIKPYREYRARLDQSGSANPTAQDIYVNTLSSGTDSSDPLYVSVSFLYDDVGIFKLRVRYNVAASIPMQYYKTEVSFSDAKCRLAQVSNGGDNTSQYNDFTFKVYQPDGTLANGILTRTNIYIRQYN